MGNPNAFLTIKRKEAGYRPLSDRIKDFSEDEQTLNSEDRRLQASRCMECGVPFCHWSCQLLRMTNDFPEVTGRVFPAFCEKGCVLNKTHEPVTIRENEAAITEIAFNEGMVVPRIPKHRNGKKVAVIGSGPSGLACATRLNQYGYDVTVYEKDEQIGGLLRFGIPDFKLNKSVIDRRLQVLQAEGINFVCNVTIRCSVRGNWFGCSARFKG